MIGGMLAGHDEGKGKLVKSNGSKYIEFYGSSSETANKKPVSYTHLTLPTKRIV